MCHARIFARLLWVLAIAVPAVALPELQSARLGAQQPAAAPSAAADLTAVAAIERAFVDAISRAEQSIVSIARIHPPSDDDELARRPPFGIIFPEAPQARVPEQAGGGDFVPSDFGAGIIITADWNPDERYILTNYHVVRGGPGASEAPDSGNVRLYVTFTNRRGCYGSIVAADPRSDLAVLKVDYGELGVRPAHLKPIRLADNPSLRKGTLVLSLGNPYAIARDGSASATWGMISNVGRRPVLPGSPNDPETFSNLTMHHFGTLLQIDNRLDVGTSGGAVVDLRGDLVGITTSLAALDGYEKSVGFAVPTNAATRRIIDALVRGFEVEYGFLGIEPIDLSPREMRDLASRFGVEFGQPSAVRVMKVIPGGPADRGGVLDRDVILDIDGQRVFGRYDLMRLVGEQGPESKVQLHVWRPGEQRELHVQAELGKWPVHDDEAIIATARRYPVWRGISVDYPTGRFKFQQFSFRYEQAVLVTHVEAQSEAQTADVREGEFISHVNDRPVKTPAEFHRAVRDTAGGVKLTLVGRAPVVVRP